MMAAPTLDVTSGSGGLRVEHLRKSYRKRVVIRDFSMHLDRGEVVALLGPNGSGKTTTFYAVAGLVYPEAGSVHIDGRNWYSRTTLDHPWCNDDLAGTSCIRGFSFWRSSLGCARRLLSLTTSVYNNYFKTVYY